jgi:cellobionic acid phosphorylase
MKSLESALPSLLKSSLLRPTQDGEHYQLFSATAMPRAAGFLWNKKMMLQMTCRGYAVAQFMQPEPAKYAYAPNLEAKTFMQPEQPYYAHHPGRFFYIKDEETHQIFSVPYEPMRAPLDKFTFSVGKSEIAWVIECLGLCIELSVSLPVDDVVELWSLRVKNNSGRARKLSVYAYFPIGYMSWMNQSAEYRADLGGIVASCVTPYQKVADYFKHKQFKDKTYFLCEKNPTSWEAKQEIFEGEGGLHNPSGLQQPELQKGNALYETPAACVQYSVQLAVDEVCDYRFIFGPAFDDAEIISVRKKYLSEQSFLSEKLHYQDYLAQGQGCLQIETPDEELNNFVNHWLPRQVFYHGDVNRLTTDPQTRNYLQDNMGMSYLKPQVTRAAFIHALSQQEASGAMPDGILLIEGAELKYINQIPHTDHCVWLPVCLKAYLDETNDYAILNEVVVGAENKSPLTVIERISLAMDWLLAARDYRGLSFIAQGDWCDPMNMVGYKGKGVSGWLTVAAAYALNLWADICSQQKQNNYSEKYREGAKKLNAAANQYLWDGDWFARGITDNDVIFGISKDAEGRIFLNPQTWAILSGAANETQQEKMLAEIERQLETPYGVTLLAPAYTAMRDDVGRVTQKHPGSAENGSVYNHAAAFYIFSLYGIAEKDRAYKLLRQMIPGPSDEDYLQRGQLPIFIPNYYRGAYHQFPRTAGRSSQLFNTGTVSWVYRCLIEGLCGLKGDLRGLVVNPQLPKEWNHINVKREFRGATFFVDIQRAEVSEVQVIQDGEKLEKAHVGNIVAGNVYHLRVMIP